MVELKRRSAEAVRAYLEGFNAGLEMAARRLETANDETRRLCLIDTLRSFKQLVPEQSENPYRYDPPLDGCCGDS